MRFIWTCRNGMNLGKFSLDMKKRFFAKRVVGHWNRLPREKVTAMPVRVQRTSERHFLSYVLVLGSPVRSRELELIILMESFQLEIFSDSMIILQGKQVWSLEAPLNS